MDARYIGRSRDRAFEVIARDFGVKAIWENMKSRADLASGKGGGMNIVAAALADAFGQLQQKAPDYICWVIPPAQ